MTVVAALLVGLGLALVLVGLMLRVRDRTAALAEILDLPFGERDVPVEAVTESASSTFVEETIGLSGRVVSQFDPAGSLALSLERAQIPLRPGEYVIITASGAVVASILLSILTSHWWLGIGGVLVAVAVAYELPKLRANRRKKAFEAQLPDALSLIASSLSAGHPFLRSVQMMCEEAEPPLADEFARVVQETRLGDPVVDAIDRMADRLDIRDVRWVVQAIRIQQTVGGKLADLLHTLADFIRAREEVRREINVLTAEGRISAYVLAALPVVLFMLVQVISPGYMKPMYHGYGVWVLVFTAALIVAGFVVIQRMVKSIEV